MFRKPKFKVIKKRVAPSKGGIIVAPKEVVCPENGVPVITEDGFVACEIPEIPTKKKKTKTSKKKKK